MRGEDQERGEPQREAKDRVDGGHGGRRRAWRKEGMRGQIHRED